jgi:hypothetical protein
LCLLPTLLILRGVPTPDLVQCTPSIRIITAADEAVRHLPVTLKALALGSVRDLPAEEPPKGTREELFHDMFLRY